jgi:hypothetical protein
MIIDNLSKLVFSNSCAVIGNGACKTDLSKQIDSSFVMRCNSFRIQPGTGSRTDLNITSLYNSVDKKLNYPVLGVLPISETLYQPYVTVKTMHKSWEANAQLLRKRNTDVWTYDESDSYSEVFKAVAYEISAFPTTGLMGIATARWLGFNQILLSGFTFFRGHTKPIASHHNANAEIRLVSKWIKEGNFILDELTENIL